MIKRTEILILSTSWTSDVMSDVQPCASCGDNPSSVTLRRRPHMFEIYGKNKT